MPDKTILSNIHVIALVEMFSIQTNQISKFRGEHMQDVGKLIKHNYMSDKTHLSFIYSNNKLYDYSHIFTMTMKHDHPTYYVVRQRTNTYRQSQPKTFVKIHLGYQGMMDHQYWPQTYNTMALFLSN